MTNSYDNYEWYLEQDLSQYDGQWVAIVDKKIVAVGKHSDKVINKASKKYPGKIPLVTKVRARLSILKSGETNVYNLQI